MEDKYTKKSCWSWKDSVSTIDKAREDCEYCTSGECRRRIALVLIQKRSFSTFPKQLDKQQNKLDKNQNVFDECQEKIKTARKWVKKYQQPVITAKQESRKDG